MTEQTTPCAFPSCTIDVNARDQGLRDWFAGQALFGLMSATGQFWRWRAVRDEKEVAVVSYAVADAMMAERAKRGQL